MKNSFFYLLLLLLLAYGGASGAGVNTATRQQIAETLTRIVTREVSCNRVNVLTVSTSRNRVEIFASIELSYYPFREANVRQMRDSVLALLPAELRKSEVVLYTDKCEIAELIPMAFRTAPQAPAGKKSKGRSRELIPFRNQSAAPLVSRLSSTVQPQKGLLGRHIALWQSHGRYFDQRTNRWKWQRSQLWQTCEDLYTQSYVLPYLVPMLENAGANVLLPRERDVQKHEVLSDNDAPGQYREQGGGWSTGGNGFAHVRQVYRTGENPFRHGTTRQTRTVTGSQTASLAVWSADIPEAGEYAIYVSYESTSGSAEDALYTVTHLGGESRFAVNQTMGGGTWIYLGRFALGAGAQEVVTLSNRSRRAGRLVSADAVKIGGGYGNIARTVCDSLRRPGVEYLEETSGYPRFCEGARYWLQWAGFDEEVYSPKQNKDDYKDDFMSRAHWVNRLMGGSERLPDSTGLRIPVDMALAIHSDAGVRDGDGIVGTLGIFFTRDNKGRFEGGADRYRSRDLTDLVMTQLVGDIRRTYEPNWSRRGLWNRSYYEARVPAAPTMLLELLSHQNFADMRYGSDPRFKFLVSRAIYKGVLRYLSSQYGTPYVVQPLPVEGFSTAFESPTSVRLRWIPVQDSLESTAAPRSYVVYTRMDEGGFDSGHHVTDPTWVAEQEPGRIYSYKVTAVNDGGESFPSEILSACCLPQGRGKVLVINGFDRISAPYSMRRDSVAGFYNDIDGGVPDGQDIAFIGSQHIFDLSMARCESDSRALGACSCDYETEVIGGNTFDYPAVHGRSIAAAGYAFCSTSVLAVERGEVALSDYLALDLILGKQRATLLGPGTGAPAFRIFTPALQSAVQRFLAAGGAIFVSGSYVGSDLWTGIGATEEDRAFAQQVLHYTHGGELRPERPVVRVVASEEGFRRGEYRYRDQATPSNYRVESVDVLTPADRESFPVLRYIGSNRPAGVAWAGVGRTCVVGFPLESIESDSERDRLMSDVLQFLLKQRHK